MFASIFCFVFKLFCFASVEKCTVVRDEFNDDVVNAEERINDENERKDRREKCEAIMLFAKPCEFGQPKI